MSEWKNNVDESCVGEFLPGGGLLYVSNFQTAVNIDRIATKLGITCVVSLSLNLKNPRELEQYGEHGVQHHQLGVNDTPGAPILDVASQAADILHSHQGGGAALVHCDQGISRSTTAVMLYLCKYHAMSFYQAYTAVASARKQTKPNPGFTRSLQTWEWQKQPSVVAWRSELEASGSSKEEASKNLSAQRQAKCCRMWHDATTKEDCCSCQCCFCIASTLT